MDTGPLTAFKAQRIGRRRQPLEASPSREPDPQLVAIVHDAQVVRLVVHVIGAAGQ